MLSFIKISVDLAELEAFLDNLDYLMSYSSHFGLAHLGDMNLNDRLVPQELAFIDNLYIPMSYGSHWGSPLGSDTLVQYVCTPGA